MIDLVTLNTWKCEGDYAARLKAMAEGLAALDADVVCLQECFTLLADEDTDTDAAVGTVPTADTAQALARHLGMQSFHAPARRKRRSFAGVQALSSSGLAILTRLDAHAMETVALPSDDADGERIAQSLLLRLDGVELRIVNTHLTHLRGAGALRSAQVATVLERWCDSGTPVVLAGDFNAPLHAPELAALRTRPDLDVGPVPVDVWPATLHDAGTDRTRAIDHVLLLRGDAQPAPRMTSRALALYQPDARGLDPSDHAAVVATLALG